MAYKSAKGGAEIESGRRVRGDENGESKAWNMHIPMNVDDRVMVGSFERNL